MSIENREIVNASSRLVDQPKASVALPKKSRRGMKGFWSEFVRELKKVDWPPAREVNRLTGVVLTVCALVVAVLYVMSYAAGTIVDLLQRNH